jgi:hypothetical protein
MILITRMHGGTWRTMHCRLCINCYGAGYWVVCVYVWKGGCYNFLVGRNRFPGIDSNLCSLTDSTPWIRYLGALNVYKYGLRFLHARMNVVSCIWFCRRHSVQCTCSMSYHVLNILYEEKNMLFCTKIVFQKATNLSIRREKGKESSYVQCLFIFF